MSARSPTLDSVSSQRQTEGAPEIERSYKARAVESFLDIHFYRKVGFRLALLFAKLRMTPGQVTLCGGAAGIAAGHLYYYRDLRWNLLGMALHILSNTLDNADGQLARLTKQGSRGGRALDGLADHLVFVSIYAHLCLRYTAGGGSPFVWLLGLAAGLSHSLQSAAADYFRNAWLYFAEGKARAELESSSFLQTEFDRLRWPENPWQKFLLRLHLNYTREQEWLAPGLLALQRRARGPNEKAVSLAYQSASRRLLKWQNLLATNPRMLLLFALLLVGQPVWYFVFELTLFNLFLAHLLREQAVVCRRLLA
ncbi:MAG TPA: CDP-alcohol phosphatidyltransferase family protein [Chthoniobacterales bacterium]